MKPYFNLANLIVLIAISFLELSIALSSYQYSIRNGDAESFLVATCSNRFYRGLHAFPKFKDLPNYYYYDQTPHERNLYQIPAATIIEFISKEPNVKINSLLVERCNKMRFYGKNPQQLLIDLNHLTEMKFADPKEQKALKRFRERLANRSRVWLAYAFEVIFLTLILGFSFFRKQDGKYVFSLTRIIFFPFIFFLPHYFGYCQNLYATVGPGGLLYAILAMVFGIPFLLIQIEALIPANNVIYSILPQYLHFFEIDHGEWASMSGGGGLPIIEPVLAIFLILLIKYAVRRIRQ